MTPATRPDLTTLYIPREGTTMTNHAEIAIPTEAKPHMSKEPTPPSPSAEFYQNEAFRQIDALPSIPRSEAARLKDYINHAIRQARREVFHQMRGILKERYHHDRWMFLQYCLTGWAESGHGAPTGFIAVDYDAGLDNNDVQNTPGLAPGTKRRPATITVISNGDDNLTSEQVTELLANGPRNDPDADYSVFTVTHETIEQGLRKIRDAHDIPDKGTGNWERHLTSVPHLGQGTRNQIIKADLTNDASLLDAYDYTAIVEVALFNEIRY